MRASKRRNYLKRTLAFVSALSMIGSFSQTIGAFTSFAEEILGASGEQTPGGKGTETPTASYSKIKVKIENHCDFEDAVDCSVQIFRDTENETREAVIFPNGETVQTLTLQGKGASAETSEEPSEEPLEEPSEETSEETSEEIETETSVEIETGHLANGYYVIEVHAKGFQKFEQVVEVKENMVYTVTTTLNFNRRYTYINVPMTDDNDDIEYNNYGEIKLEEAHECNHPGVMKIGDVNGDGKLTSRDSELLLEAINYSIVNNGDVNVQLQNGENLTSDLNHDGQTNLADLTMFTRNYLDTYGYCTKALVEAEQSKEYLAAVAEKVETEVPDNVEISQDASFAELTGDSDKVLELGPKDGAEIDDDHPVEVSWPIEDGYNLKELNVDTNAAVGEIIIEPMTTEDFEEESTEAPTEAPSEEVTEESEEGSSGSFAGTINSGQMMRQSVNTLSNRAAEDDESTEEEEKYSENAIVIPFGKGLAFGESEAKAETDEKGLSVDLGEKIAIKKITIRITKVKNTNLAQIAKVEMLNGMESRMEEPPIAYPINVKVTQAKAKDIYAKIVATWDMEDTNGVTGYDFEMSRSSATRADGSFASPLSGLTKSNTVGVNNREIFQESEHGNFKLIQTNSTYYVHVRATGDGDYKSDWSDAAKINTVSYDKPSKPDYVNAVGKYRSIAVSWGGDKTNATKSYDVYYRKEGDTEYESIKDVNGLSCVITKYKNAELEDRASYEVYVVAKNQNGESPNSDIKIGETTFDVLPKMPRYNAINMDENGNVGSAHIVSVTRNDGEVIGNEKDKESKNSAWAAVDGDPATYYRKNIWDDGGYNGMGSNGITTTFDAEYEIGSIGVTTLFGQTDFGYIRVKCWDENGKETYFNHACSVERKVDKNGKEYRIIKLPHSVKAKKVQIAMANSWASGAIVMSEICFYAPDKSYEDIMNLYTDDLHLQLKDGVTQEHIDYIRYQIRDEIDPISGETNPNKDYLLSELKTAEDILNDKHISNVIEIHSGITTNENVARNFSGLNAWQPLGAVAGKNTEIVVYVGCRDKNTGKPKNNGDWSELRLIQTQYNSESNSVEMSGANLRYGINRITLNPGKSLGDAETGGSLYIQYSGAKVSTDQNFVRVSGATAIPMLDIYGVDDIYERYERAAEYVEELDAYVKNMENLHNEVHKGATFNGSKNTNLDRDYKKETCLVGATEILDDRMMYSLPAAQILAGLGGGTAEERAVKLITSMDAMEDMMDLFYQHKGISPNAKELKNCTPCTHLNIRYQRMFADAAMYAAGNHIGIPYGSASGLSGCAGVKSDKDGKYISGSYFGWGIAHEIGHCLNDSNYADNEITNNYFALLAQSKDSNSTSRLNYNNVFAKVTSGTKGKANQATQLGLYWQLHLAYDKDYNYKTYDSEQEIFDNLFYARMDTYSRNPELAPNNLSLNADSDQKLMRLACAAANKNVLEFFERWGKIPNGDTVAYASRFDEKEERAIIYANEDSRMYAMTHESPLVDADGNKVKAINEVKLNVGTGSNANKVTLNIDVSDKIKSEDILGYEIIRSTISHGNVIKTPIAFSKTPTFTDTVTSYNNRTVSYEVTIIDHHLNRSEMCATKMIKVHHDGSLEKKSWSISTKNLTAPDLENQDNVSCHPVAVNSSVWAIDDNFDTVYAPQVTNKTAEIIMNFDQPLVVTGLKYTAGDADKSIGNYTIFVKDDAATDEKWVEVAKGTFNGNGTVYFSHMADKYIGTYDTTAVKLQINNQNGKQLSIAELDVLGVTNDNVDFLKTTGDSAEAAFGYLTENYQYGTDDDDYIPAGSLVFTGSYKGHPLYNAVLLYDEEGFLVGRSKDTVKDEQTPEYDEDGNIIGLGEEDEGVIVYQTVMADVPDGALITNVSEGIWIYWIEPAELENMVWPEKVRVELYRVNNAITMEGQRLVSDSLFETLPAKDKVGNITLKGGKQINAEKPTEAASETDSAE